MIFVKFHVPVVCGATEEVQRYLEDNKFKLISMSLGREKMQMKMVTLHI